MGADSVSLQHSNMLGQSKISEKNTLLEIVEHQKAVLDTLIESLEPTEIVIDVITIIQECPNIFGSSARVITHLLLPTLYRDFGNIGIEKESKVENLDKQGVLKRKKKGQMTSDVQDAVEYIKIVSQTWYNGRLDTEPVTEGGITISKSPHRTETDIEKVDGDTRYADYNIAIVLGWYRSSW